MSKSTILVVEDDASIRMGIVDALKFDGYTVLEAGSGTLGLELGLQGSYDLMLLDQMLPGMDGLEVLRQLREARPTTPVIMLTARGAESDRIRGLKAGADDYVVKPFSLRELLARIEAVLRRSPERPMDLDQVAVPGGAVDFARCEVVFVDGRTTELSERELQLLRYLVSNANRAVSRDELLSRVWGMDPRHVETRTIDMHVARLRDKLRDADTSPDVILTVRGKGYMFREAGVS